ncbi:MAG: SRPBCC family protein [Actinobacteria bacterium]|nr:SRPBCC family protein [Actinomycetota bacterium]
MSATAWASAQARLVAAAERVRNWGATGQEQDLALPGDELVAGPASVTTRAVTVAAPPEEVWRWLVQIGQDRGGMYSYDWLENALGLRIHSADRIREEWQHLDAGDRVRLVPKGWLGLKDGFALPVARVEPGRAIVLREQPPQQPWDAVWSFHVIPLGAGRCRLISRSRSAFPRGAARLATWAMEPVTLVMTRKMLLGIKHRAERRAQLA